MDADGTPLEGMLSRAAVLSKSARSARFGVGAVVVLALLAVAVAVVVSMFSPHGVVTVIAPTASASPGAAGSPGVVAGGGEVFVHVLGAVNRPGLYRLDDGARGFEAIAAAGGYAEGADESAVNLARFVSDGEQLVVPVLGEAPAAGAAPGVGGGGGAGAGGVVNLNTASVADLETLPRIGPAMAARIIEWREANGRFTTIDDLGSVAGIGEKTLDGIRDLVGV